ncbi:unnamed protein product, partial [Eretmochelys imbricata]
MATAGFWRMRTGTGRGRGVFRVCSARQHVSRPPWRWRRGTAAARWSSTGAAWPPAPPPGSRTVTSSSSAWPAAPPPSLLQGVF